MIPGDVPCAVYHRAVDSDRPAAVPHWSTIRAVCIALATVMLCGVFA